MSVDEVVCLRGSRNLMPFVNDLIKEHDLCRFSFRAFRERLRGGGSEPALNNLQNLLGKAN